MPYTVKYRTESAPVSEGEDFETIADVIEYVSEDTKWKDSSASLDDVKAWAEKSDDTGIMLAGYYGDESENITYYVERK